MYVTDLQNRRRQQTDRRNTVAYARLLVQSAKNEYSYIYRQSQTMISITQGVGAAITQFSTLPISMHKLFDLELHNLTG